MSTASLNDISMSEEKMLERIEILSSEMDANEEENRAMQNEINALYAKIDSLKTTS